MSAERKLVPITCPTCSGSVREQVSGFDAMSGRPVNYDKPCSECSTGSVPGTVFVWQDVETDADE